MTEERTVTSRRLHDVAASKADEAGDIGGGRICRQGTGLCAAEVGLGTLYVDFENLDAWDLD